jgi:hypothetical protein
VGLTQPYIETQKPNTVIYFEFCDNKEKLGLSGDLNLGPLSPLSDKFQTIKLSLILCFHIKVLIPLLFIVFCINNIVTLIHELRNIIYIV